MTTQTKIFIVVMAGMLGAAIVGLTGCGREQIPNITYVGTPLPAPTTPASNPNASPYPRIPDTGYIPTPTP